MTQATSKKALEAPSRGCSAMAIANLFSSSSGSLCVCVGVGVHGRRRRVRNEPREEEKKKTREEEDTRRRGRNEPRSPRTVAKALDACSRGGVLYHASRAKNRKPFTQMHALNRDKIPFRFPTWSPTVSHHSQMGSRRALSLHTPSSSTGAENSATVD